MAFHTPGGGEIQLLAYQQYLCSKGIQVDFMDIWKPNFLDYDLVHFFSCIGGSVHFCNYIKSLGLPLVVSSSLWLTEETKSLYPAEEIAAQLNLADAVIVNSIAEGDMIADVLKLKREKFHVVLNGVDNFFPNRVDAAIFRQSHNISSEYVLNVGNIEPRKNQLILAKAMKKFPRYKLVLAGHIRNTDYAQQVFEVGGDQLIYCGVLGHSDEILRSAYAGAKLFSLPSTLETPGLAALEAYVSGCNLMLTKNGCTKEYFHEEAIYVDPFSLDSISEGLILGLADGVSLVSKRMHAGRFTWDLVLEALPQVYSKVLSTTAVVYKNI
jgi:glycosyltransferase involved in cell wall biosynthesis